MRILAIVAVIGCVIGMSGCAAPAAGAGPKANVSLAGRWSGSFMARQGGEGGSARLVIDADGRVRGSLRDAAMQPGAVGTPRMATLDGRVNGGQMKLQVSWVGGAAAGFSGDCSNQALGSLGVNLLPDSGPASGMIVLSLHEQGVSGKPPFGEPAKTVQPDFQKQWTGNWIVNWYDGGPDYGSGVASIAADGTVSGQLVDDAFNTAEWNQPVNATLKGKIGPDGAMAAGIAWSDGRPGWSVNGKVYFTAPESFQIQLAPKTGAVATRTLTFTFHRGQ